MISFANGAPYPFSPDGSIPHVDDAQKAADNRGTVIGIRGKDGIVLGVEKLFTSKLSETENGDKRIHNVDRHVGMAVAVLDEDDPVHLVVERARKEASQYLYNYEDPIPLKYLAEKVANFVHAQTVHEAATPFEASIIMGSSMEEEKPQIFLVHPSGELLGYHGCSIGKSKQAAKTEIEKLQMKDMSILDLVKEVAKILYIVCDKAEDKPFELELSWAGERTGGKHELVPPEVLLEAKTYALEAPK